MGSIIKARCQNCHYQSGDLYYGGGMTNFQTVCNFPVMDKEAKICKTANIMEKEKVLKENPNLVFYDDKSLSDEKSQNREQFHQNFNYKVYFDGYLCPKCNQFSLGFEGRGNWD